MIKGDFISGSLSGHRITGMITSTYSTIGTNDSRCVKIKISHFHKEDQEFTIDSLNDPSTSWLKSNFKGGIFKLKTFQK